MSIVAALLLSTSHGRAVHNRASSSG